MRGMLTAEITALSVQLLGYEMCTRELRLMPYLHYCVTNDQNIERTRINPLEREILVKWEGKGFITSPLSALKISKHFYQVINDIIFASYIKPVDRVMS